MKAYNLHAVNDFRYEEVSMPECESGWAVVEVKAAGICSSDVPRVFTKGTYHFPTIPGHEFAGIVHSVADSKNAHLIGKHVGVFPLIPCRRCPSCQRKQYEICEHYDYIGSRRNGAFAEYVAVPIWNLVEIPSDMSFEIAAMLEPFSVALHAVKFGDVKMGDSVAIIGTGMIGVAAGQWAKKMGAKEVVVIGRNENKRQIIENCGLKYSVGLPTNEADSYDFVLEAVGSSEAVDTAIIATRRGGRMVLMGNPVSDIILSQVTYWKILRKQLRVSGTWNSSYDGVNASDWTDSVKALANHEIEAKSLITHHFMQDELMAGLLLMKLHKEPYCKIMTLWNR